MVTSSLSDELKELAAGYVLDNLDESERQEIESLMGNNPALREEIRQLQAVFGIMAHQEPILKAPAQLRDKVLLEDITSPRRLPWRNIITGIALLSIFVLAIDNFRLRQQFQFAQKSELERVAALLQRSNSRLIAMTGEQTQAAGTLLFTPGNWQEVVLSLQNLPPLPPDEVYRLWLTLSNNQTIFCGEFNTNDQGKVFIKMNPPQTPPKGVKAKGLFVTVGTTNSLPTFEGKRVMTGLL